MKLVASKYSIVRENQAIVNGDVFYRDENFSNVPAFLKAAFRANKEKYPKFFKMDNLSKLAFLATELALKDTGFIEKYNSQDIAIVIQNSSSTVDVDTKYWDTVKDKKDYFPNPSLFVYTLPNILIGEICIKNKLQGENSLYVFNKFEPDFFCNTLNSLFESNRAKACITGWVDFNDTNYDAFIVLVEKEENCKEYVSVCTPDEINKLFLNS